jgi:hypothetical protein
VRTRTEAAPPEAYGIVLPSSAHLLDGHRPRRVRYVRRHGQPGAITVGTRPSDGGTTFTTRYAE